MCAALPDADLERAVDVRDPVRIAVDEDVDRDLLLVGQPPDEPPGGARRHAAHRDQDAVGRLPELVALQPLEHTARLDRQDELRLGLELEVLDRGGDRVGAAAEPGAVDPLDLAGLEVRIEHDQLAGDRAAVLVGDEAELLAVDLAPEKRASMSSITVSDSTCSWNIASPQFFDW